MLRTIPPQGSSNTFLGFPLCTELDALEADIAILGIPYGYPYSMDEVTNDQANAPTAAIADSRSRPTNRARIAGVRAYRGL